MKSSSVHRTNYTVAALLTTFGIMLLIVNVLLAQQNKKLKNLASRPDRALEVKPGTALPPLEGMDSHGNRHSIRYSQDSRKTVLFVLSSRCGACKENMPNWEAIIDGLDPQLFRVAAVSLESEGVKEFANQHGINRIPILTKIDPKKRVAYKLALTPQTILIDAGGKAEKVWTGLLQREDKRDVEQTLNVRLP